MSEEFSDISDFTFPKPKGLLELGECECGNGIIYGRMHGDQKRYLQAEGGRDIRLCTVCDEKAYPPESMKRLKEVSLLAQQEDTIRAEYNIPYHENWKAWLIENHGKKVTVGNETKVVHNIYDDRFR